MKYLITLFVLSLFSFSQKTVKDLPIWTAKQGYLVDKSLEEEKIFLANQKKCKQLYNKDYANLSDTEKKAYNNCNESEIEGSYWSILGYGDCSWYCGADGDTLSASSFLKSNYKTINYLPQNAHDLSYETAWVEGVEGYGIGESLTYSFPPRHPRITEIKIINGYVKSEKVWRENSRVKQLKLYINGVPTALLNLEDNRNQQSFTVKPIGNSDRNNLKEKPWWTLKFEITEVYKGEKYEDTAITEIYFDGIDVH